MDIAENLVAAGNARAQSLGLGNLRFQQGDASDLNELADDSFDLVVSIFGVTERFARARIPENQISFERSTYTFDFAGSPSEFVAVFRDYYGPTMNAFDAARANGREAELQAELEELFAAQNTSQSGDSTSIPATFLRVTADV